MSRQQKLLKRFRSGPKDFSWNELQSLLAGFGYEESNAGKTSGSRCRFIHEWRGPILLHKPHPDGTLKAYQVRQIVEQLEAEGLI